MSANNPGQHVIVVAQPSMLFHGLTSIVILATRLGAGLKLDSAMFEHVEPDFEQADAMEGEDVCEPHIVYGAFTQDVHHSVQRDVVQF